MGGKQKKFHDDDYDLKKPKGEDGDDTTKDSADLVGDEEDEWTNGLNEEEDEY